MVRGIRNKASVLLVSYAGYPTSPNSLMPDNGMASLAAQLKSADHQVRVLDLTTVSLMRRLVPPFYHQRLSKVLQTFVETSGATSKRAKAKEAVAFLELKALAKGLDSVRSRVEMEIAEEIAQEVRDEEVDLVGFKLWNGDGFSGPVRMAGYLKQRFPDLLVAAGGPQVKFFKDQIFDVTHNFDVLGVGDGEAMILPLAEAALGRDLAEVPNIYYRQDGSPVFSHIKKVADMDALPFPIYGVDVYPAMEGNEKIMILVVEDRRGCENVCKFCVHPGLSGANPRSKSAARVVNEFEQMMSRYGVSNFRLGGSSSPAEMLHGVAQKLAERGLEVNWTAFARIKDSRPAEFAYLRDNGLFGLFFGIESANQQVLDAMGKNTSPERIEEVILATKEAGIFATGSVIYPAPFDTAESRQETFELLQRIRPDSVPLQFMGIYPQTVYARNPERYNFEIVYPSLVSNLLARMGLKEKAKYDSPEVMRYLIEYKIPLLFPPKFWAPLPWKINGMGHKAFASETQSFYEDLKGENILCFLTDEEALMAHQGGYQPKEFADKAFDNNFTGDWRAMAEMVQRINRGL